MAEILTGNEIAEIEARENLATEGPWRAYYRVSPRGAHKKWHIGNETGLCQITMGDRDEDYEFMAHARSDIPRLIASHRALAAERDNLKEVNQGIIDGIKDGKAILGERIRTLESACGAALKMVEEDINHVLQFQRILPERVCAVRDQLREALEKKLEGAIVVRTE